jgi:hypothetical protein
MDLIAQQWISRSVWRCTIGRGEWLHNDRIPARKMKKPNLPRLVCRCQSAEYPRDYGVRDGMAPDNGGYSPSLFHERKDVPKIV